MPPHFVALFVVFLIPQLALLLFQILGAFLIAPQIKIFIPSLPYIVGFDANIFVWAIVFAIVVYGIGVIGTFSLNGFRRFVFGLLGSVDPKPMRLPGPGALTLALMLAFVIAALTLVPQIPRAAADAGLRIATLWWPLIGAMVGYFIRR